MDIPVVIAVGFLLVFLVFILPVMREQYEEEFEDDRDFFRERRPRMWGLVEGVSGGHPEAGSGVCPACGVENDAAYTYCRNCDNRLPG